MNRFVEITSNFPELLPCLVRVKQESPYAIIERDGSYYLSFLDSADPRNTEPASQSADFLMSQINVMLSLPPFRVANALKRTGRMITRDDQGHEIGQGRREISSVTASLSQDFTGMDFSHLFEMEVKASRSSRMKQALRYYGEGRSWFNLYDVFECIRKDCQEVMSQTIPQAWTTDATGRNRLADFKESANNAYISGYTARHTFAESHEIERISDTVVRLKADGHEIKPMTLSEAGTFIENLLTHWLGQRGIHF